jgi:hypothetical protein
MTGEVRDEVLGAALRKLEVPEHRPGFQRALAIRQAGSPCAWWPPTTTSSFGRPASRTWS